MVNPDIITIIDFNYFGELSPSISTLSIYLQSLELSDSIQYLQTLFKSEDGILKLVVKKKGDEGKNLLKVKIKEESQQSIKIKPKQTQFTPIDRHTLAIRFSLD